MPYYWKNNYWRRRRARLRRWRIGKAISRRRRRRRAWYRRRHYRVRRKFYKKLPSIRLKQFQPQTIQKCKIIGKICLFQGSPKRCMFNYTQYMYSPVPEYEPGGGGYAVLTESLGSLWEDFEHLRNIWTKSNVGLPLVRYEGVTLYFYQSRNTDYVVEINKCLPMKDYKYTHADTTPNRMLLKKYTLKIPSRETRKKRKPYKKVRVRPPPQFQNKWYFQKDICDIPLIMVLATACDLTQPYGASNWESNNITMKCLNPQLIQNNNFSQFPATHGWFPKPNTYWYKSDTNNPLGPQKNDHLCYLGNTKDYFSGKMQSVDELKTSKVTDWGNPFYHDNLDLQSETIWMTTQPPSGLNYEHWSNNHWVKLTEPIFVTCRYNPEKDKGTNDMIYVKEVTAATGWEPPENPNLIFEGFPLFDITWGYIDWQEKVHDIQNILDNYIIILKSDVITPKLTHYIPVSQTFIDGRSAYRGDEHLNHNPITDYDHFHWYPRVKNQLEILNTLAMTGPGCPRSQYNTYLQAQMGYIFHFRWGGCPKTLEKPFDPCSQPDWIIPRNFYETIQMQNPGENPETILQKFDWRRDYVKQKAIDRIKEYTEIDDLLPLSTGSKRDPPAMFYRPETSSSSETETETEEEKTTSLQTQIKLLRKQQRELKRNILKRLAIME
nr:MAG: ORF1 [TTV-like mini virus]